MTLTVEPGSTEVGHGGLCNSRTKQTNGRCRKTAGWGTDHQGVGACKLHGGSTPSHEARARGVMLATSIGELIAECRPDAVDLDPVDGLLEVVAHTWAMRRALERMVDGLSLAGGHAFREDGAAETEDGTQLVGYVPVEPGALWGPDHKGDAKPHVLVTMLADWTDRHARACKLAIDAGIEQRRIELAEGQAQQLADVLRAGMAAVVQLVAAWPVDAGLVRELEAAVPGLLRGAIEGARVIDVNETKET